MNTIKKQLTWLDNHLLEIIAGFLLVFLPLYPKWPLLDALPGYIVRVRLEDFVVFGVFVIFLIQVKRGKAALRKNPLFVPIMVYLVIGLLSSISAVVLTQTVPFEGKHVGKLLLHWARRVEYMSLALVFYAAVSSYRSLKRIILVFFTTGLIAGLYGIGQKYLEWPVYSTMNREFSKGWRLVLTEYARVSSTFAGHYDFAAFSVVVLLFCVALFFVAKKKWQHITLLIAFVPIYAAFLLTGSRTSFIAYLGGVVFISGIFILLKEFKKAVAYGTLFMLISWVGVLTYGPMKDRFASILRLDRFEQYLPEVTFLASNIRSSDYVDVPQDLDLIYEPGDTPPTSVVTPKKTPKPGQTEVDDELPADVYEEIPVNLPEASLSAVPATAGTGEEGKKRTYSPTASAIGLSSAIRFDALWPRAWAGFKTNPLLGSGYSTLVKVEQTEFTEAESTDNDYLRALGETGLLGLGSFVFILLFALWKSWQYVRKAPDNWMKGITVAYMAGVVGLMINALYIDIFVSSKVAYTLWALSGLMFAAISLSNQTKDTIKNKKK